MKNKLVAALFAVIAASLLTTCAWACGGMNHDHGGAGSQGSTSVPAAKTNIAAAALLKPYFAILASLSTDSLDNVATNAAVFVQAVKTELSNYPEVKKGMVESTVDKAKPYAKKGLKIVKRVAPCVKGVADTVEKGFLGDEVTPRSQLEKLLSAAESLENKDVTLQDARNIFGALSDVFVDYLRGNVDSDYAKNFQLYYCGMAKHYWIQNAGENIGNPYLGTQMPECGETVPLFGNTGEKDGEATDKKPPTEAPGNHHGM